ncbi:DUF58 domain-containing protein [Shewanella sp. GXUN23E]|uniref:DUF58 domain-containing protein n=1 Tax=Shewanella sp. GXUN23E TaxID=3422498 RepID=UPI003D7D3620
MNSISRRQSKGLWQRWLDYKLPAARQHTLSHNGIFILPTAFGIFWLLLVVLLFLFGTNYQNNLVIALSLIMGSIFNTCLIFGYRNLAGLTLKSGLPAQVYAGETLAMPIQLDARHAGWQIELAYPGNQTTEIPRITGHPLQVLVAIRQTLRGRLTPGRLKVSSCYPMGLCRAWSHLDMAVEPLVFAAPIKPEHAKRYTGQAGQRDLQSGTRVAGVDEFSGLRDYIPGESPKQIAWKQVAQGRGMLIKQFEQPHGNAIWLTLPDEQALEQHLSALGYLVDNLSRDKQIFGLSLISITLGPGTGEAHRLACQEAIALYRGGQS